MVPVPEAVPSFSEGRDLGWIREFVQVIAGEGAEVLDWTADLDHYRSIEAYIGSPVRVEGVSVAAAGFAMYGHVVTDESRLLVFLREGGNRGRMKSSMLSMNGSSDGGRTTETEVIGMIPDPLVLPNFKDRFRILRLDESRFLSRRVSDYVSRSRGAATSLTSADL